MARCLEQPAAGGNGCCGCLLSSRLEKIDLGENGWRRSRAITFMKLALLPFAHACLRACRQRMSASTFGLHRDQVRSVVAAEQNGVGQPIMLRRACSDGAGCGQDPGRGERRNLQRHALRAAVHRQRQRPRRQQGGDV